MDPHLSISGQSIPYVSDKSVRFLGLEIQIPSNQQRAREIVVGERLHDMLKRQTVAPLQPVRNYKSIDLLYAHGCLGR